MVKAELVKAQQQAVSHLDQDLTLRPHISNHRNAATNRLDMEGINVISVCGNIRLSTYMKHGIMAPKTGDLR